MYDLIIKNGTVVDGTGNPAYISDIAVCGNKIASIAKNLDGSKKIIDAAGLTVSPGFIDSHSHADDAMLDYPSMKEKIEQGITTSVSGQCGISFAPLKNKDTGECITFGDIVKTVKTVPMGANIVSFVGHGAIRKAIMGVENRKPTVYELEKMKELLYDAMENGAAGISFGLIYTPGCYADFDELLQLSKVVKEYGGLISTHIRNESFALLEAVEEFLKIAKAADVRAVLSHHKAMYKANRGKVVKTIEMIDEAVRDGYDIYCDAYPYTASNTTLVSTIIPASMRALDSDGIIKLVSDPKMRKEIKEKYIGIYGDDLSYIQISYAPSRHEYDGMRLNDIAKHESSDPFDTVFNLIRDCGAGVMISKFVMCEEDVETVIRYERAMLCTDSSVAKDSKVYHPRLKASFPRALGRYVRDRHIVSLEEMIRKCTSLPASVYGLSSKGLIKEGYDADICIFDKDRIIDKADFSDCTKRCEGLNYVIVGGEIAAENAIYNGVKNGGFIQRRK